MARTKELIAFLDTHIIVWLYDALSERFTARAKKIINTSDIYISPLSKLELRYLYEIGKIKDKPEPILASLSDSIALKVASSDFKKVVDIAVSFDWTRDPFDRLLTAEAHLHNAYFVTADKTIHKHFQLAVW